MPRAGWRGFLSLSLVSCPVYLAPATTRAKPIRLHQVWQPASVDVDEDALLDRSAGQQGPASSSARIPPENGNLDGDQSPAATRVALRPHDPETGEAIDKREVVRGYEYSRGQFVTFTPEELKALDVESSKVIDLEKFVSRSDLDPIYLDSSYYLHPDGPIAVETLRVIGAAMAETGVVGLGRLTLSRRERVVMVEPRGTGMGLFTLRAADEVRVAQFASAEGDVDTEMVAIAKAIIARRTGTFDPSTYRDRYREALRELIEAKMQGLTVKPKEIVGPPPVIDLMAARLETQPRAGNPRFKAQRRSSEESEQDGTGSAPSHLVVAGRWRSETQTSRCPRHPCREAAQPGLISHYQRSTPPNFPRPLGRTALPTRRNAYAARGHRRDAASPSATEASKLMPILPRYWKFESISLQRTVRLSTEVARRGREPRLFARVWRPCEVVRSGETGIARRYGA
jgi:DNA end-binding protein Ku